MHLSSVRIRGDEFPSRRCYPFNVPTLAGVQELHFQQPVTLFVGENGSGKSTLLDAIARRCGIHVWDTPRRHLAHNNPFETRMAEYVTATWTNGGVKGSLFRAETFRELADFVDDVALCDPGRLEYQGGRILNTLSHGEGILSYLAHRFRLRGLYFLDEPEAALSPASQIEFLHILRAAEAAGQAQFIIATHSPILLAYPNAQIFAFEPPRIRQVGYRDTRHYKLYAQFLADPSTFLSSRPMAYDMSS
ncbi:MAG TPA: AAA family ATPase [Anaerolineae bacterium]|nr:AAA family ATPase [Anaerolineae bacterium]